MGEVLTIIVQTSRVALDPRFGPRWSLLTPTFARSTIFESGFDFETLFADIFRDDAGEVVTVGPPLRGALAEPGAVHLADAATGTPCSLQPIAPAALPFPTWHQVGAPDRCDGVLVGVGPCVAARPVRPSLTGLFAGRRVLLAKSKDNRLEWIADWARFHQVHHGIDGVVLYDNASTAYRPEDVAAALREVPGLAVVAVVPWVPPHRTLGSRSRGVRREPVEGQILALEHARRRMLAQAALVLHLDIDELLVPRSGKPVDDLFLDPEVVWVRFDSQDMVCAGERLPDPVRHGHVIWAASRPAPRRRKWAALPSRFSATVRFRTHGIDGGPMRDAPHADFTIAHCLPITTAWTPDREQRRDPVRPDRRGVEVEPIVRACMEEAFEGWEPTVAPWTPADSNDPDLLRAEAQCLAAAGEAEAALVVLQRAIALDPWHPAQAELRRTLLAAVATGAAQP